MCMNKKQSLLKTMTYFIADSALTGVVAVVVTREPSTALSIALGVQVCEVALYYFHERVWERLKK